MQGVYFADAFYWIAVAHPRDAFHSRVMSWRRANTRARLVTTEEVLTELLNWFAGLGATGRLLATDLISDILADPRIQILPQTTSGFHNAIAFYRSRLDKEYSLVDCGSMVAMRSLGLTEVLSNDRHFGQEGFTVLFP